MEWHHYLQWRSQPWTTKCCISTEVNASCYVSIKTNIPYGMQQYPQRGMGMLSAMGMMGGNPAFNQQTMMQALMGAGLRQGLDMSNPIIVQMMIQQMQQAMGITPTAAPQMQKLMGMYPGMGMSVNPLMMAQPAAEEVDDEDEDMVKVGIKHPDPVVETASMSSVEPPDVWYEMSIPEDAMDTGKLSALQLESITYAAQQHEHFLPDGNRAGFLIGDGAGVGKGRTIAGIILENFIKDRKKSIWISVSNDLKYDAERDLKDIGAGHIPVHFLK
ncbi:Protein strawberry notch-like protein 1 [Armadillidium vulgare]|nr:Protein strawberry notch-like protein 1 [Armadillidium vulgare]